MHIGVTCIVSMGCHDRSSTTATLCEAKFTNIFQKKKKKGTSKWPLCSFVLVAYGPVKSQHVAGSDGKKHS